MRPWASAADRKLPRSAPFFVRIRKQGKHTWQKHPSELDAKKAAESAPVERKAEAFGLLPDDVTGEVNANRTSIKTAVETYLHERRFGRPRSIAVCEKVFEQLLSNLPAGVRIIDQLANKRALKAYVEFLRGQGYSDKTSATRMGFVFPLLKANGVERPSRRIKPPKFQQTRTKPYGSEDLAKLFAVMTPEE
jgi:uncharacterized protein with PIN domain